MRVGLIGAGGIGRIRAKALVGGKDCALVAVADPEQERADRIARSAGARAFGDHRDLLAEGNVDAVIVSTPPPSHESIVLDALDAGMHVLCEKPLSNSVESCRRMVERARSTARTLATGFNHRYFPAIKRLRYAIQSGEIGRLDHVRAFAGHTGMSELQGASWLTDARAMGGGTLMDNGIHLLDLTRFLMGEVSELSALVSGRVWETPGCEDNGLLLLRSPDGCIASLQSTWTEWRGYRFWLAAYGDRGTAWARYAPMLGLVVTLDRPGGRSKRRFQLYPWINLNEKLRGWESTVVRTFREEHNDFRALIEGRNGSIAEGFDGFRAVEMAAAARRSSEEGRSIELCEAF